MASNCSGVFSGSGEMSRSGSRGGGTEGRQAPESPLFSPPAKTRSDELKRAQLLEGKKHLKKMGIQDSAPAMTSKELATAATVGSDSSTDRSGCSNSSLTNDLLQLLVSEIARMRCTLDNVAQDKALLAEVQRSNKALLAEVQRSNKLLALSLVTSHKLENYRDHYNDHEELARKTKEIEKIAEVIVNTVSPRSVKRNDM